MAHTPEHALAEAIQAFMGGGSQPAAGGKQVSSVRDNPDGSRTVIYKDGTFDNIPPQGQLPKAPAAPAAPPAPTVPISKILEQIDADIALTKARMGDIGFQQGMQEAGLAFDMQKHLDNLEIAKFRIGEDVRQFDLSLGLQAGRLSLDTLRVVEGIAVDRERMANDLAVAMAQIQSSATNAQISAQSRVAAAQASAAGNVAAAQAGAAGQIGAAQARGAADIAVANIQTEAQAALQAAQQIWQSLENELNRSLELVMQDRTFGFQSQESALNRNLQQILQANEFGFTASENSIARQFAAEESQLGREFEAGQEQTRQAGSIIQSLLGQRFAGGESALDRALNASQFAATHGLNSAQVDLQRRQLGLDAASQLAQQVSQTDPLALPAFLAAGGGNIANALASGADALSTNALLPAALTLQQLSGQPLAPLPGFTPPEQLGQQQQPLEELLPFLLGLLPQNPAIGQTNQAAGLTNQAVPPAPVPLIPSPTAEPTAGQPAAPPTQPLEIPFGNDNIGIPAPQPTSPGTPVSQPSPSTVVTAAPPQTQSPLSTTALNKGFGTVLPQQPVASALSAPSGIFPQPIQMPPVNPANIPLIPMQTGGVVDTDRPTLFMTSENNQPERVSVQPLAGTDSQTQQPISFGNDSRGFPTTGGVDISNPPSPVGESPLGSGAPQPTVTQPALPSTPPLANLPGGQAPVSPATQPFLEQIRQFREQAALPQGFPQTNPFHTQFFNLSPTLLDIFFNFNKSRFGIPVQDQIAEAQRFALSGVNRPGVRLGV